MRSRIWCLGAGACMSQSLGWDDQKWDQPTSESMSMAAGDVAPAALDGRKQMRQPQPRHCGFHARLSKADTINGCLV